MSTLTNTNKRRIEPAGHTLQLVGFDDEGDEDLLEIEVTPSSADTVVRIRSLASWEAMLNGIRDASTREAAVGHCIAYDLRACLNRIERYTTGVVCKPVGLSKGYEAYSIRLETVKRSAELWPAVIGCLTYAAKFMMADSLNLPRDMEIVAYHVALAADAIRTIYTAVSPYPITDTEGANE